MDTLTGPMAGFDIGMPPFPNFHFTVNNGELSPNYSHSSGNVMYDSPPVTRRPRLHKQSSLDETNRKKVPNSHSPPMKKKSEPGSPPILENNETLIDNFEKVQLNDATDENQNVTGNKKKRRVSFADACGKELAHVQLFQEEETEEVKVKQSLPELKPLELVLPLPVVDSETFKERFGRNHMILEKLTLGTVNVTGRIRVQCSRLGEEERRVAVRYTKDGWMSYTKQPARTLPRVISETIIRNAESDTEYDLYCFDIGVDRHSPAIQFMIVSCDCRGKAEFEDDNGGEMYTVLNPNFVEPPQTVEEEDEEEWEAYMRGDDEWCNDYY